MRTPCLGNLVSEDELMGQTQNLAAGGGVSCMLMRDPDDKQFCYPRGQSGEWRSIWHRLVIGGRGMGND